jgi:hypothetical protein
LPCVSGTIRPVSRPAPGTSCDRRQLMHCFGSLTDVGCKFSLLGDSWGREQLEQEWLHSARPIIPASGSGYSNHPTKSSVIIRIVLILRILIISHVHVAHQCTACCRLWPTIKHIQRLRTCVADRDAPDVTAMFRETANRGWLGSRPLVNILHLSIFAVAAVSH